MSDHCLPQRDSFWFPPPEQDIKARALQPPPFLIFHALRYRAVLATCSSIGPLCQTTDLQADTVQVPGSSGKVYRKYF
jgi:hypothetical protein